MDKIYIELKETDSKKGFGWGKNWNYYYLFPATDTSKGVVYRMLVFDNEEDYSKRLKGDRIDAKQIVGIKEMVSDKGPWYSGMLFNRDEKQAWYVNLYDNTTPSPEKNYEKLVILKQAEYREKTDSVEAQRAAIETGD